MGFVFGLCWFCCCFLFCFFFPFVSGLVLKDWVLSVSVFQRWYLVPAETTAILADITSPNSFNQLIIPGVLYDQSRS